jgi:hypothetical protein
MLAIIPSVTLDLPVAHMSGVSGLRIDGEFIDNPIYVVCIYHG